MQASQFDVVYRGAKDIEQAKRHDLSANNAAIKTILDQGEREPMRVVIQPGGIRGTHPGGRVQFEANINNVLLAGNRANFFVVLLRNSVSGSRQEGSHTVHLLEGQHAEEATEMCDLLNKYCRDFVNKLKGKECAIPGPSSSSAPSEPQAIPIEYKVPTRLAEPRKDAKVQAATTAEPDEYEAQAFTAYEYTPPVYNGRVSVSAQGQLFAVERARRRPSGQYGPQHLPPSD
ncbi:uncharacterized protein MONBRDRAFT_28853 [Monosiga brevicollis MX1]|uniref:Uncharacterized protein n=1 Tax=Monosiga brevicollis TaxID=81824 RepID=A9V990_MONBE|nr:uncharacterized protein MONBRDRAFT_28853 [Monosiga brevicollis MX1]EDQ85819.1 predicted protein [Monosiga brevicollis MX1]|eukprot:XP_001749298.1 hypothetical protein [Monosiga brevicollis MX1]